MYRSTDSSIAKAITSVVMLALGIGILMATLVGNRPLPPRHQLASARGIVENPRWEKQLYYFSIAGTALTFVSPCICSLKKKVVDAIKQRPANAIVTVLYNPDDVSSSQKTEVLALSVNGAPLLTYAEAKAKIDQAVATNIKGAYFLAGLLVLFALYYLIGAILLAFTRHRALRSSAPSTVTFIPKSEHAALSHRFRLDSPVKA